MSAATPPGKPDISAFNQAFTEEFGKDQFTVTDLHINPEKMARMTVQFNGKEYQVTVGSEFISGWNAGKSQDFAKQLGALLLLMHEYSHLKTGFVRDNTFSYNGGEPIDLNNVAGNITKNSGEIDTARKEIESLKAAQQTLREELKRAEDEVEKLAPTKTWPFRSPKYPQGEEKYNEAVATHKAAAEALSAWPDLGKLKENEEKLKELQKQLAEYKLASLFAEKLSVPAGIISVTAVGESPASPPPLAPLPLPDAASTHSTSSPASAPAAAAAAADAAAPEKAAEAAAAGPSSSVTGADHATTASPPGYNTAVREDASTAIPPEKQ